jgi:hypothetical protein
MRGAAASGEYERLNSITRYILCLDCWCYCRCVYTARQQGVFSLHTSKLILQPCPPLFCTYLKYSTS